jgi:hypothetical protein
MRVARDQRSREGGKQKEAKLDQRLRKGVSVQATTTVSVPCPRRSDDSLITICTSRPRLVRQSISLRSESPFEKAANGLINNLGMSDGAHVTQSRELNNLHPRQYPRQQPSYTS